VPGEASGFTQAEAFLRLRPELRAGRFSSRCQVERMMKLKTTAAGLLEARDFP